MNNQYSDFVSYVTNSCSHASIILCGLKSKVYRTADLVWRKRTNVRPDVYGSNQKPHVLGDLNLMI